MKENQKPAWSYPAIAGVARRFSRQWRFLPPAAVVMLVALPSLFYYIKQDQTKRADGHRGATSEEGAAHREGYEFDPKSSKSGLPLHAHPLTHTPHNPPHLAHLPPAAHAPMECSSKVTVWAVGDCAVRDQPLAVLEQRCSSDPPAAVDEFKALLKQQVAEYRNLRELRSAAGTLLNGHNLHQGSAYLPPEVWGLRGEELFVFPACTVGATYTVPLPSKGAGEFVNVTVGSTSPRVMIVDNFLTAHECDELIGAAREKLGPSTVSSQGENAKSFVEESRTSSTAWLPPHSHSLAHKLYERASEVVGIPFKDHPHVVVEDLQVLRYEVSQHYHIHHDYFDPKLHHGFLQGDGRNRFITILFYLSDVEEGGETCFPMAADPRPLTSYSDCKRGLNVRPQMGKAVIFYSLAAKGQRKPGILDESSWHSGCDVRKGVKWGANYWVTLKHVHE